MARVGLTLVTTYRVMAHHPELCLLVIALYVTACLTLLGKFSNSSNPKSHNMFPLYPKKFFPPKSPVLDFPFGNLDPVGEILQTEEFIFIMYYAPWCSKSMAIRWEFHKAAKFMHGKVKFVGVNCWYPTGQCHQRNKFLFYPMLYAYLGSINGFHYRGWMTAEHMVRFLEDLTYPVTPIFGVPELQTILSRQDTAVFGFFDFKSMSLPPGYLQFYYAAMRVLEQDPRQPVMFAVVSSTPIANAFNVPLATRLLMVSYTGTQHYGLENNFTSSAISQWVLHNRVQPLVKWIVPQGSKSLLLSMQIQLNRSVILFTSADPLFNINWEYNMMKEVSSSYTQCNKKKSSSHYVTSSIYSRFTALERFLQLQMRCEKVRLNNARPLFRTNCCISIHSQQNISHICSYCVNYSSVQPLRTAACEGVSYPKIKATWNFCKNPYKTYNANHYISLSCLHRTAQMSPSNADMWWRENYAMKNSSLSKNDLEQCRRLSFHKQQNLAMHLEGLKGLEADELQPPNRLKGMKCLTNKTLNFYAMDLRNHWMFAENLGLNSTKLGHGPTVVLIDIQNEEQYIMKQPLNPLSLGEFVLNYTSGDLRRHSRTSTDIESTTDPIRGCDVSDDSVCITDVTSASFQSIVIDSPEDVLLMFYAPWCGFCAGFAHVYLAVAKYFKLAKNIVFARINADTNDLPWEFTMDSYPTLLLFPAKRKADSVVFPDSVEKTLPNVIQFVFNHARSNIKHPTIVNHCSRICVERNIIWCSRSMLKLEHSCRKLKRKEIRLFSLDIWSKRRIVATKYLKNTLLFINKKIRHNRRKFCKLSRLRDILSTRDYLDRANMHRVLQGSSVKSDVIAATNKLGHDEL